MADFDKLKQIDIDEIHRKTRITLVRLHDILDKKFDNIDPARAHGFIKILERELQLDLSDWVREYDEYKQINIAREPNSSESNALQTKVAQVDVNNVKIDTLQSFKQEDPVNKENSANMQQEKITKPNKQTANSKQQLSSMNIEISMPKQQVSHKTMIIALSSISVVLLISLGIYFIGSNDTQESHIAEQNDTQKQVVEKDIKQTYPTISLYDALNDNEQKRERMLVKDSIHTNEARDTNKTPTQQNTMQTQDLQEGSKSAKQEEIKQNLKENDMQDVLLTITPQQDVWFAWTDTITKVRGEKYTKKTPVTLTIKNPTVFHFGYAVLNIKANGENFEYNQRGVTYMLYDKKQGMKLITQKEYKALGGK
ncbi:MAG: hypothetical protein MR025_01705 [Helicobacter trogontum]|uniref:hypothetical protein n=1 Tax=Helicobacter trogontum TaxID=50960 RepID=UPI002432D4DA|nr:hypothetical protein [Helicobacter trogontum]MCI5786157.1 hypothetical protein [Helicobacter trogontum]